MKEQTDWALIAVIIVVGYLVLSNMTNPDGSPMFELPASIINIFIQNPQSNEGNTPPPPATTTNERAPTSLTVTLNTYDCTMGSFITGSVTSNGYNYPVKVYVKHVGSGEQSSLEGLLGADGRFHGGTSVNTPGVIEVWAYSNGVTSNKVTLHVHGCRIVCDKTTIPFSPGAHIVNIKVYGDGNSHVTGFVNDPAHSAAAPWPNVVTTNAGGYASTTYDFVGKAKGNYEVDAIVNGNMASTFGASWWIEVK